MLNLPERKDESRPAKSDWPIVMLFIVLIVCVTAVCIMGILFKAGRL